MGDLTDAFRRNSPYVDPAALAPRTAAVTFNTPLPPMDEMAFRQWLNQAHVPFNPDAKGPSDYDMRGFYQASQNGDPRAHAGVDPNDGRVHFSDPWKTPNHETFSSESQYAGPAAPRWTPDDKLVTAGGRVQFDDKQNRDPSTFGFR